MSLWEILTGQGRPKTPQSEPLFILTSLSATLEARNWQFRGKSGLSLKEAEAADWAKAVAEAEEVLNRYGSEHGMTESSTLDGYNYRWLILAGGELADHVTALHMAAKLTSEAGFPESVLAAVLSFQSRDLGFYLVYNYRRGRFYPFLPVPGREERRNDQELRLKAQLGREMPWEEDLSRWYALWDLPF